MRKFKIAFCIAFALSIYSAYGQTEPELPGDGEGQYLDEVPIDGEVYFLIAALGVGGFFLFRRQKNQAA